MKTILLLTLIIFFSSCAICKPPRNNSEMEQRARKHDRKPFIVQSWMKMRSDGYWVVTKIYSNKTRTDYAHECKPDSSELFRL